MGAGGSCSTRIAISTSRTLASRSELASANLPAIHAVRIGTRTTAIPSPRSSHEERGVSDTGASEGIERTAALTSLAI